MEDKKTQNAISNNNTNLRQVAISNWLKAEFKQRWQLNHRYSLRAFARFLSIDPSTLSQILAEKRNISDLQVEKLSLRLGTAPSFFNLKSSFRLLTDTHVEVLKSWEHIAILELSKTEDFVSDAKWIATRLGLAVPFVQIAIEQLLEVGLLVRNEAGNYVKSQSWISNIDPKVTTMARKILQKNMIQKAVTAIDEIPQEIKDITAITFPCDMAKLAEAKKLISDFRRTMAKMMSIGETNEVMQLTIQMIPITNVRMINKEGEL